MATETQTEGPLLIATIKAVLEKKADNARLQEVLTSSRKGLEDQIQDFHATIDGLSEEMRGRVTTLVDGADEVFGFMENALTQVEEFLQAGDDNLLYQAGSTLRRGADQLNYIFNELRNFVLAVAGPTPIPNLNLILRAYEVFTPDKDKNGDRLKEFVFQERLMALHSLDQLEQSEDTPDLRALKGVWEDHLRCMNRLFMAIEKGDRAGVTAEVEKSKITFARLYERIPSATMSQRLEGETKSHQVNLALSLAVDVEHQVLHDGPLAEALSVILESNHETHEKLEQILQAGVESVMLREQIESALEGLEYQQEALAEFTEFFENRETLVLRSARSKLQESTIQLTAALDSLADLADREGKVGCVRCGHYNPTGRSNCERCSVPLPNLGHQTSSTFEAAEGEPDRTSQEGPVLTSNLVRLYTAVNNVFDGAIDHQTFLAEVEWYQGVIDSNSEYTIEEPNWDALTDEERAKEEDAYKILEEVQNAFASGVSEMLEGLERFRAYVESEQKSDLEEGMRLMDSGSRKVAAVRDASTQK